MHPAVVMDKRFSGAREGARELAQGAHEAMEAVDIAKQCAQELEGQCGFPTSVELFEEAVLVKFKRDLFDIQLKVGW